MIDSTLQWPLDDVCWSIRAVSMQCRSTQSETWGIKWWTEMQSPTRTNPHALLDLWVCHVKMYSRRTDSRNYLTNHLQRETTDSCVHVYVCNNMYSTYFSLCDGPASKLHRPRRRVAVFVCCWMQVRSLDKAGFQPFLPIQIAVKLDGACLWWQSQGASSGSHCSIMPQKAGPVCKELSLFWFSLIRWSTTFFEGRGDDLHLDAAEDGTAQCAQHSCQGRKLGSITVFSVSDACWPCYLRLPRSWNAKVRLR